jgi:hypothetical protein
MIQDRLYAHLAPVFESYGMELRDPERSFEFLVVTDMVAFGLVANWMLRLLDAAEDDAHIVLDRLGPVAARIAHQIEHGYDTWLMQLLVEENEPALLRQVIRLGINGTSWSQWQAESARLRMSESFLDECVHSMVKTTWFELAEGSDIEAYLETLTMSRLVATLHDTITRQAGDLGIPILTDAPPGSPPVGG